MTSPTPKQIKRARLDAGLSQAKAAALLYLTTHTWKNWESGRVKMPPDRWLLFHYLTSHPEKGKYND